MSVVLGQILFLYRHILSIPPYKKNLTPENKNIHTSEVFLVVLV